MAGGRNSHRQAGHAAREPPTPGWPGGKCRECASCGMGACRACSPNTAPVPSPSPSSSPSPSQPACRLKPWVTLVVLPCPAGTCRLLWLWERCPGGGRRRLPTPWTTTPQMVALGAALTTDARHDSQAGRRRRCWRPAPAAGCRARQLRRHRRDQRGHVTCKPSILEVLGVIRTKGGSWVAAAGRVSCQRGSGSHRASHNRRAASPVIPSTRGEFGSLWRSRKRELSTRAATPPGNSMLPVALPHRC